MKKTLAALSLLLVLPLAQAGGPAGVLYAIDTSRVIYTIDPATGTKTQVATAPAATGFTAGLAVDPVSNTVFVTGTTTDSLYRLDLTTGDATLIGSYGVDVIMHGLEWDSSTGTLYGASSAPNSFYRISTTTGAATLVGNIGFTSFNNLGYDSTNNVMFMTNSSTDSLYTINRGTGAVSLVGALLGPTNPNGLAYAADVQTMYMIDNNTDSLYTLNLATGAATLVGSTGAGNLLGLVYVTAVPEPATCALFGLGLAGLAAWQRRRPLATAVKA